MQHIFLFVLGLCSGSFANVYFYRLPRELSLLTPNSFCPRCQHPIPWFYNIPILSYLVLKGKCNFCQNPISLQYPFVELLCGLLFLTNSLYFKSEPTLTSAAILFFSFLLFLAAGIDIVTYFQSQKEYGIIPDHLVWLIAISGLLFSFSNPLLKSFWEFPFFLSSPFPSPSEVEGIRRITEWGKIILSLSGALVGFLFLFGTRQIATQLLKKEALGLGDIKLICAVGLWLGWQGVFLTVVFSSLLGSIVSVSLILSKKLSRRDSVPFAPFLSFGAFLTLFFL